MHAWIAMAFGDADNPYADIPSSAYAYDDRVQNHKQVQVGDLLFLRNRAHLEGIGRIDRIEEGLGEKKLFRCPVCGSGRLHRRKGMLPPFKCNEGHEFGDPKEILLKVHTYKALFEGNWIPTGNKISIGELRPFELRDSKQLAIMPVDASGLCRYVSRRCPNIADQLSIWSGMHPTALEDVDADNGSDLTPAGIDEREQIARGIRLRRGQATFRNSLIGRYDGRCVITGCSVLGVLEAAHIRPYRGPRDNHPANGVLLRSDLHTLFDLNRIAIDPVKLTIVLHPSLLASEYADLQQKALLVTAKSEPDKRALQIRWKEFIAVGGGSQKQN